MADDSLKLIPAAAVSSARLSSLLNEAYADYFLPVWLDEPRVVRMCQEVDVTLAHSVLAVAGDELVGVALLSQRGDRGWISGVGVVPSFRRQGIARQMVAYLQQQARILGLRVVLLEVLAQNAAGLALYQSLGFRQGRELLALLSEPNVLESIMLPTGVRREDPGKLLATQGSFHIVDPSWQRDLATLAWRRDELQALALWEDHRIVGYLLYQAQKHYQTIYDLAVLPAHPQRLEAARRLLLTAHSLRPDAGGAVINIPAEDDLLPVFLELHYRIWQRQNEMIWELEEP